MTLSRRTFVRALGASAALAGLSGQLSFAASAARKRPNLIFILTDDLGYGDLSCYGRPDYNTPNLDTLAADGARLTDAYAAFPVCTPTRTAFITGRYPQRTSVGLFEPLPFPAGLGEQLSTAGLEPNHPTVASLLKTAGYETALIGKWHLGYAPQFNPTEHGFDEFFGHLGGGVDYHRHTDGDGEPDLFENDMPVTREGYLTDLLTDRAVEYVSRRRDNPFFLFLSYNAPHWPWDTPTYDEPAFGLGDSGGGSLGAYREMMQNLDGNVGRTLAALRENGLEEDTLVIFTSDNGGERFSYNWPLSGNKAELLEGGVRVPALIRWPGVVPAGAVSEQAAITMDWSATLLAAGGAAPAADFPLDGQDLLPVLQGEAERERLFLWRYAAADQDAVRRGDWKYLRSGENEYLFNLAQDVREQADLKDAEPAVLEQLKGEFAEWNASLLPKLEVEPAT